MHLDLAAIIRALFLADTLVDALEFFLGLAIIMVYDFPVGETMSELERQRLLEIELKRLEMKAKRRSPLPARMSAGIIVKRRSMQENEAARPKEVCVIS